MRRKADEGMSDGEKNQMMMRHQCREQQRRQQRLKHHGRKREASPGRICVDDGDWWLRTSELRLLNVADEVVGVVDVVADVCWLGVVVGRMGGIYDVPLMLLPGSVDWMH